jgi:hypothetical protein
MLRVIILVIALLLDPALTAAADMSDCNQLSAPPLVSLGSSAERVLTCSQARAVVPADSSRQ